MRGRTLPEELGQSRVGTHSMRPTLGRSSIDRAAETQGRQEEGEAER